MIDLIKKVAENVYSSKAPIEIRTGKVISVNPLKVRLSQKIVLESDFIVVPERFTDHDIKIKDLDGKTGTIKVYGKLKTDDIVILTRNNGGTEYYITDKIGR
ncbi:MAG: DUF2577 domain-containing protein [Anaerovoracaceae bacterium]